ncbi:MAG: GAF domain-containing protein, partial [Betaproteobacteria bacterium]
MRRMGARIGLGYALGNLIDPELSLGEFEAVRARLDELDKIQAVAGDPVLSSMILATPGTIMLLTEGPAAAIPHLERAAAFAQQAELRIPAIQHLTLLARAQREAGAAAAALRSTTEATRLLGRGDLVSSDLPPQDPWFEHARALFANRKNRDGETALGTAYASLLEAIGSVRDIGLRRNYLNKIELHRDLLAAWLEHGAARKFPKKELYAHLDVESNPRAPFQRLADTGLRLNALRTPAELYGFLVEEATELSGGERVLLVLEQGGKRELAHALAPRGEDASKILRTIGSYIEQARVTGSALLLHTPVSAPVARQRSRIVAPMFAGTTLLGYLYVDMDGLYGRFDETDRDMMGMLANQAAVALENARWSTVLESKVEQRTEELKASNASLALRNEELAIINSIQEGLAAELDFQAIIDLVGDRLRAVFPTPDITINWYEEKSNTLNYLYCFEHGKRLPSIVQAPNPGGLFETMRKTRQPIVINTRAEMETRQATAIAGTDLSVSLASVPIISSDRVLGLINLENYEREYAFGESELRLLTTIAASLGTALENARLFAETQRLFKAEQDRVAELQIINSIQQGLASKLDLQAIIELVGEKLRQVLNSDDIGIRLEDPATGLIHYHYEIEHGERLIVSPRKPGPLYAKIRADREPVFGSVADVSARYGVRQLPGTDVSLALAVLPITSASGVIGTISVESFESADYFNESNIRLMQTIAASMGVALENARLFDETQRLLKETEQRNAELAVINSIQQGVAGSLDFQGIVDLVGDKLREVLHSQNLAILWHDPVTGLNHRMYLYEHGERLQVAPSRPTPGGPWETVVASRRPLVYNTTAEGAHVGVIPGTDESKSTAFVPIIGNDRVLGVVQLEDFEREQAYGESEIRLLSTIASSMGVALQSARLFDETQRLLKETEQRNAELAIINSVQDALAAELNIEGIYSAVGDKIRDIFHNTDMSIRIHDPVTTMVHYPYVYERGVR